MKFSKKLFFFIWNVYYLYGYIIKKIIVFFVVYKYTTIQWDEFLLQN